MQYHSKSAHFIGRVTPILVFDAGISKEEEAVLMLWAAYGAATSPHSKAAILRAILHEGQLPPLLEAGTERQRASRPE